MSRSMPLPSSPAASRAAPALRQAVKICGLSTPDTLEAALDAGADMVGFVFHPKSPRYVTPERAVELAAIARGRAEIVALIVDYAENQAAELAALLRPDWLQLHGKESVALTGAIRRRCGVKVMRALGVSAPEDLVRLADYAAVSDMILIDAKPPKDAAYPGGHGRAFDWTILAALDPALAFMLSGGLTPDTVADAITAVCGYGVSLAGVDVSTGVETQPGVKDADKIKAFLMAARTSFAAAAGQRETRA